LSRQLRAVTIRKARESDTRMGPGCRAYGAVIELCRLACACFHASTGRCGISVPGNAIQAITVACSAAFQSAVRLPRVKTRIPPVLTLMSASTSCGHRIRRLGQYLVEMPRSAFELTLGPAIFNRDVPVLDGRHAALRARRPRWCVFPLPTILQEWSFEFLWLR